MGVGHGSFIGKSLKSSQISRQYICFLVNAGKIHVG